MELILTQKKKLQRFSKKKTPPGCWRQNLSSIIYQEICRANLIDISLQKIIETEPDIGYLGPSTECECLRCLDVCKLHAIMHDVFGRVFTKFQIGRRYCYAFDAPNIMKKSPLLGNVSGFFSA